MKSRLILCSSLELVLIAILIIIMSNKDMISNITLDYCIIGIGVAFILILLFLFISVVQICGKKNKKQLQQ